VVFAGAAGADQRDQLAGFDGEVDVSQHRLFAIVEIKVFKTRCRPCPHEAFWRVRFRHGIFQGEQLKDAFAGGARLVKLVVQPRERLDGRVNHHDGEDKHEEIRRLGPLVGRQALHIKENQRDPRGPE